MKKETNSVKITLIIVIGVIVLSLIGVYTFINLSSEKTISSRGVSSVLVIPDLVKVYFNIETKGDDAKEAKDENARIVDLVREAILDEGFKEDEISTLNFNVYEDYEYINNRRVLKGYKAVHTLVVSISTENKDLIGDVIDAGIDNGANLNYINYELSQELENNYKADALRLATKDARIKAEAIAEGLGVRIKGIVSVNNEDFSYYPYRAYDMASYSGVISSEKIETEIQPQEQEISASVNVVYSI